MSKVLILYAHPRNDRSEVNSVLAKTAEQLPNVTLVDLYREYPTFEIDVEKEQKRLLAHDVIVLQHPVYWYSSPSILKEWQDLVLQYGFAYGHDGNELKGKIVFNAATAGSPKASYQRDGLLSNELRDFFKPFEYMARLCGMQYLPPFAIFKAAHTVEDGLLDYHAEEYRRLLVAFGDNRIDMDKALSLSRLNDDLDNVICKPAGDV